MNTIFSFLLYFVKAVPIVLTALSSDYCLREGPPKLLEQYTFSRAICDNVGHGFIALFLWLSVINYNILDKLKLIETLICFFTGSLIDLDHFYMAGSFKLQDALNLPARPPLHNSSIIFLLIPLHGLIYSLPSINPWLHHVLLAILTGIISHHLRDGNRRGIWVWPIGNTPPLQPDWVYISLIIGLPFLIVNVKKYFLLKGTPLSRSMVDIV